MLQVIGHRGPDDEGMWGDECAVLGHRRLSIIDQSLHGHQPMRSDDGRYVMVYNGEIYNYHDLRKELTGRGVRFMGNSDSEVLLAAFTIWGETCVQQFNGMWAFAIWDTRARRLFVSRDRFGEKPFYYVYAGEDFWFASEIKALLEVGAAARQVNPAPLVDFAADRISDHSRATFFASVLQLPPATSMWLDGRRIKETKYWAFPKATVTETNEATDEEVGALLEDAVRLRLRSDVSVGVLLSGGLDSSSVACLAALNSTGSLAAFSTIDKQPPEEALGIKQVLEMYPQLDQHVDTPPEDTLERDLTDCLWHQEEPFADGSMLAHFRLMRSARAAGVRVLLTGQAADEVFAGYPGFQNLYVAGLMSAGRLPAALRYVRDMYSTDQHVDWHGIVGNTLPQVLAAALRRKRAASNLNWLASDYQGNGSAADELGKPGRDVVNDALMDCLRRRTLPGFLHYEDRNAMAFGVETRGPFLDHRLVERVLPIGSARKLKGGRTKAILRNAVAGKVPDAIVRRLAKQGYPAPLARWLRNAAPRRRQQVLELVAASPLIDFHAWSKRLARFDAGMDAELPAVWRGLVIAMWHNRFIGTH